MARRQHRRPAPATGRTGGICVSGKVAKEVEKKLAFGFEPMGEQKVKNIAEPVQAYRVIVRFPRHRA